MCCPAVTEVGGDRGSCLRPRLGGSPGGPLTCRIALFYYYNKKNCRGLASYTAGMNCVGAKAAFMSELFCNRVPNFLVLCTLKEGGGGHSCL